MRADAGIVVASHHEQPVPIFQQFAGGYPSGRDDVRYPLSLRNVEDLLAECGIDISHETVRLWWNRFGPMFAAEIRKKRVAHMRGYPQWRWHLDEVFVKVKSVSRRIAHGDSGPRPCHLSRPSLDPHRLRERPRKSDRADRRGPLEGDLFAAFGDRLRADRLGIRPDALRRPAALGAPTGSPAHHDASDAGRADSARELSLQAKPYCGHDPSSDAVVGAVVERRA